MTSPTSSEPQLPTRTAHDIFDNAIVPVLLGEAFPHPHPSATLVVGQPGSGVGAWTVMRDSTERDAPETVVDLHSLRSLFPGYAQLRRELGGVQAAAHVEADVHRWLAMTLNFLRERRAKVVIEDDIPSVSTAALVLESATAGQNPYPVDVALLAVPAVESRSASLESYQHTRELLGHAPEPDEALHAHGSDGVVEIAEWVDTASGIRSASVYSGVQDVASVTRRFADSATIVRDGTSWPTAADAMSMRDLFETVRGSDWDYSRSQRWVRGHSSLWARMEPRWRPLLSELDSEAAQSLMFNTNWRMERAGLTFGHYPVITTTNVELLTDLLIDHDKAIIGVLDPNTQPASTSEAVSRAELDRVAAQASSMMSPGEQVAMWLAVLQDAGIRDRVEVTVIDDPAVDPTGFNNRFPYTDYRLVLPAPPPDVDRTLSTSHGYARLLARPVHIQPQRPGHGPHRDLDSVRRAYRNSNPNWEHQLARGSVAAFLAADGPARVLAKTSGATPGRIDAVLNSLSELATHTARPAVSGPAIGAAIEAALPPGGDNVHKLTTDRPRRHGADHGPSPTHGPSL